MPFSITAKIDLLRTLGNASISTTYAGVGTRFTHDCRIVRIINATAGDMFFAMTNGSIPASDGSADQLFLPAGTFLLYDLTTNGGSNKFTNFVFPRSTQIWVRQSTAPASSSVYVETVY
jgi:hypothetical protein